MDTYNRSIRGLKSRSNGEYFERMIMAASRFYENRGIAVIDKGQISRNVVTEEQEECFERYMKMGAMCFLVISLEFEEFYRVPWIVFRDMKKIYGHKYMNREELAPYRVKYNNGVVKYLDGITLRERNEDESTEV